MATGRERDEQLRRAQQRADERRARQTGTPHQDPAAQPRHSGFRPPHAPGTHHLGPPQQGAGHPINVNVVGNQNVMQAMRVMAGGDPRSTGPMPHHDVGGHGAGAHRFGANINSDRGLAEAASQVTREMHLQVESAQQLARASAEHLTSMRRIYDQERDAVQELTEVIRNATTELAGSGGSQGAPAPSTSQGGGTRPAGPRSHGGGRRGGHQGTGREHYDPAGLLGNGPIHGGRQNAQLDLMRHIAGGGDPEDFDGSSFMTPGRNHPTSYGELSRNLRIRAARAINDRYGEPSRPSLTPKYDEHGKLSHYEHDAKDGKGAQRLAKDDPKVPEVAGSIAKNFGATSRVSSMMGAMAEGGIGAATKAIPVVGTAIAVADGVNKAMEWVTEQRAANAQYQAIEGGSNFTTGFGERARKLGNRWSERFSGGMTGEQSDRLFDTLTAQGYSHNRREGYLHAASDNYRQYGMDPQQTAQMIVTATNHANMGLLNMAESIRTVTDTAIKYGTSADTARQQLARNAEQLGNMGIQGSALFPLAAADTAATTAMGRNMQGVDFTGMAGETDSRIEAAMAGMPYGRFVAQREQNPALGPQMQDKLTTQLTQPYMTGKVGESLQRMIQKYGGKDKVASDPNLQRQVVLDTENETGVDFSGLASTMQAYGIQGVSSDDPTSAGVVGLQEIVRDGKQFSGPADQATAQHQQRNIANPDEKSHLQDVATQEDGGFWSTFAHNLPFNNTPTLDPKAINAQKEVDTGHVDQTIDQLLDPARGVVDDDNVGVKVKTKQGDKVVPMTTALNKYRDQVAKGTAVIVGGPNDGKSVKDITGGAESNYQGPSSEQADVEDNDKAEDEKSWRDRHDDPADTKGSDSSGSGSNVNVTVTPGPELRNWFQFNTGDGGATHAGAATGQPTAPGGLPNGGSGTPAS